MENTTSKFDRIQFEIIQEISKSIALLGGKSDIIGTINSWGDSISDNDTLDCIKSWNEWKLSELNERLKLSDSADS